MKRNIIKYVFCILVLSSIISIQSNNIYASTDTSDKIWSLTGQEVLLDITDASGKMTPGIYALSVDDLPAEKQPLQLLIPYGSHPKWSWHHKKFVYYFNGDIWLCDINGNKASLFPFPSRSFKEGYSDAVNWSMDGRLLFTIHGDQKLLWDRILKGLQYQN